MIVSNFSGRFQLEVNTTGQDQTIQRLNINKETGEVNGLVDGILPAYTVRVSIGGSLEIIDAFSIKGSIDLVFNADGFEVSFNATLDLSFFGGISVQGGAIIRGDVFAMYLGLGVKALSFGPFGLEGNFTLKINTSNSAIDVGGITVAPHTAQVHVDATLNLWVFKATGSVTIDFVFHSLKLSQSPRYSSSISNVS